MPIQKICAGFETTLAAKLTAGGTSFTLSSHLTKKGVELSGEYGFILGEGTATEEWLYGTVSSGVVTIIKRGLDPEEPETEVTALKFDHDRGTTSVKITDYPFLGLVRKYLGGEKGLPAPLKYATHQTPSEDTELIDKKYAQELLYGAVGTASPSAAGTIFTDQNMGAKPIAKTIIAYEQATPDMTIKVAPFNLAEIDKHVNFSGGNSPTFTAPVANPRIDILVYDIAAAALEVRAGSENASPVAPALESGDIAIAKIYHKVGETSINNSSDGTNGYILNLYNLDVYRTDILKTSDIGTSANKIIQLDENAKLPAVDGSQLTNIPSYIGAGSGSEAYHNYILSIWSSTLWVVSNFTVSYYYNFASFTLTGTPSRTFKGTLYDATGVTVTFAGTKKIIVDFWVKANSGSTNNIDWGLGYVGDVYNNVSSRVSFSYNNATGKLYAAVANGSAVTLQEITGITITNKNQYRIVWNPGVSALFYVNGVLKQTITTNLPSSGNITVGHGMNGTTDYITNMSAPMISLEK